mmetsp:Transcript_16120/g.41494  ORF Transcript_16120/g.41494 Transcript_16120/m.41494 type:complete len:390 (+) Transcript_16120:2-1171(+)
MVGFECEARRPTWVSELPKWILRYFRRLGFPLQSLTVVEWSTLKEGGGNGICRYNSNGTQVLASRGPRSIPSVLSDIRSSIDAIVCRGHYAQSSLRSLLELKLLPRVQSWTFIPIHISGGTSAIREPVTNYLSDDAIVKPVASSHRCTNHGRAPHHVLYPALPHKGQSKFISALRPWLTGDSQVAFRLRLIGEGVQKFRSSALPFLETFGHRTDPTEDFCNASCIVLLPDTDRNPRVIYEALALGKPVVYSEASNVHPSVALSGAGMALRSNYSIADVRESIKQVCFRERAAFSRRAQRFGDLYLVGSTAQDRLAATILPRSRVIENVTVPETSQLHQRMPSYDNATDFWNAVFRREHLSAHSKSHNQPSKLLFPNYKIPDYTSSGKLG